MYQLPVNNLARIRKARKQVKKALEDIGLEYCKEAAEDFKEFCPNEQFVKSSLCLDICAWDPSYSKTQEYRSKPFCCTECSFSSKYYSGYKNHFRNVHRKIFDGKILLNCPYCTFTASKKTLETHVKIFHITSSSRQNYGTAQGILPGKMDKAYLDRARQGDGVEKPMYYCKKCSFRDTLYNVVRRHIYREHFQHIVSPYLCMVSESSVRNGANSVNGNNILCKGCQFTTRSYEALVQHVIEYHERIGAQVTTMIGHANVLVSRNQAFPVASQKTPLIISRGTVAQAPIAQPVIGYLKPVAPVVKKPPPIAPSKARATHNSVVPENNPAGVNTAQTQKWKICTVCNELFPENLYSAHFENAHKAKKVWALAKYIMKIHNFTSKCLLCNRYLPSDTLLNHMLIHGLTCPQCHAAFHNVEKIMEHVAQIHPEEYVGPPGSSPLTFDLTIKQDKSSNVQLLVLTFNMKETTNGQDQLASAQSSVPQLVKVGPPKIIQRNEPLAASYPSMPHKSEVGKTLCPLCFTILKGPISEALAMHLRERHQVLQTMHPVEKKMTYKCIHCLGVYTSNMVASTITLHLVQCRAVGRTQAAQGFKSSLTLNSSGAGFIKRQPPAQTGPNPKKIKLSKESKSSTTNQPDDLALDPRSYEHKTYEARKNFLTAYFNRRPYLSAKEVEKLSASLWLWKSDIASHFSLKQRMCERMCLNKKVSVLLGFDMHAVKKVKHDLTFEDSKFDGLSTKRPATQKSGTKTTDHNKQSDTLNCTLKLSTCTETISIDSDSDIEEVDKRENENVDATQHENVKSSEPANPTDETKSVMEETKSVTDEIKSLMGETNCVIDESKSLMDEMKSAADETTSVIEELKSMMEETTSVMDKSKSLMNETTSVMDESTSVMDESTSVMDESTSLMDESTSLMAESTSLMDESTSLMDESKSMMDESTSVMDESTSVMDESKSVIDETTSVIEELKSMMDESKSVIDETTVNMDDVSEEKEISLQDGESNACMSLC
ncbi:activity-dependent neuroprotector homeobox a [Cheilinus undulatus]|uniref:activity-dependent neuroprotector homeobox a n=1 Tax=Cheilinus undulatus TaxID=241271 RepID=UPI001BD5AF04|nr:activity-dependent neuroprotector homeobox a [Cheilinus undulatus]